MKQLHFIIGVDGNVKVVDATGFGTSCQSETEGIEAALGKADEATRHATDSLYQEQDPLKLTQSQ